MEDHARQLSRAGLELLALRKSEELGCSPSTLGALICGGVRFGAADGYCAPKSLVLEDATKGAERRQPTVAESAGEPRDLGAGPIYRRSVELQRAYKDRGPSNRSVMQLARRIQHVHRRTREGGRWNRTIVLMITSPALRTYKRSRDIRQMDGADRHVCMYNVCAEYGSTAARKYAESRREIPANWCLEATEGGAGKAAAACLW